MWNGEGAPRPSANRVGLEAYTLIYPSKETLQEAISKVNALEVQVESKGNTHVVEDPSGNRIILCVR